MPKLKTHRGTAKRVKLTAKGELLRRRANSRHNKEKMSKARKRVIATTSSITGKIGKNIKRALGV